MIDIIYVRAVEVIELHTYAQNSHMQRLKDNFFLINIYVLCDHKNVISHWHYEYKYDFTLKT